MTTDRTGQQPWSLAVASGKGGTGKTTVAVNLFHRLQRRDTLRVELVDCDVEEPNSLLFFDGLQDVHTEEALQLIPNIRTEACTFCRACVDYCEFNAIVVIPPAGFADINPSLCHSCGACLVACKEGAIGEHPVSIGTIRHCRTPEGSPLTEGRLNIGSAMQTLLIRQTIDSASRETDVRILDAPPGTSCPVVTTVADADYTLLVTEPTPFGLHDLRLTVEMLRELGKEFGVVVNKAGAGDRAALRLPVGGRHRSVGRTSLQQGLCRPVYNGDLLQEGVFPDRDPYESLVDILLKKRSGS
ncbi:MAG: ATP-binding protein [Bacteroidales bacterium]